MCPDGLCKGQSPQKIIAKVVITDIISRHCFENYTSAILIFAITGGQCYNI